MPNRGVVIGLEYGQGAGFSVSGLAAAATFKSGEEGVKESAVTKTNMTLADDGALTSVNGRGGYLFNEEAFEFGGVSRIAISLDINSIEYAASPDNWIGVVFCGFKPTSPNYMQTTDNSLLLYYESTATDGDGNTGEGRTVIHTNQPEYTDVADPDTGLSDVFITGKTVKFVYDFARSQYKVLVKTIGSPDSGYEQIQSLNNSLSAEFKEVYMGLQFYPPMSALNVSNLKIYQERDVEDTHYNSFVHVKSSKEQSDTLEFSTAENQSFIANKEKKSLEVGDSFQIDMNVKSVRLDNPIGWIGFGLSADPTVGYFYTQKDSFLEFFRHESPDPLVTNNTAMFSGLSNYQGVTNLSAYVSLGDVFVPGTAIRASYRRINETGAEFSIFSKKAGCSYYVEIVTIVGLKFVPTESYFVLTSDGVLKLACSDFGIYHVSAEDGAQTVFDCSGGAYMYDDVSAERLPVEVSSAGNGTAVCENATAAVGSTVLVSGVADDGFVFENWTDHLGRVVSTDADYYFTMPYSNVRLVANFVPASLLTVYNGTKGVQSDEYIGVGRLVKVDYEAPQGGFEFDRWEIEGAEAQSESTDAQCVFVMPEGSVTVRAVYREADSSKSIGHTGSANPYAGDTATAIAVSAAILAAAACGVGVMILIKKRRGKKSK